MNKGIFSAVGAYILWGLLPIYWKALANVPAFEILAHRIVWALGVALVLVAWRRDWAWLRGVRSNRTTLLTFVATATLITINWGVYIWAVNAGHIVETSLGYFINPLVNVLLGVLFLRERLRLWQGVAVGIALGGVLFLTFLYGSVPWIALVLATSFGFYGLLRKTATLNSLEGFTLETLLLFIPALGYLVYTAWGGAGAFGHSAPTTTLLLIGAGVMTAVPLLWFATSARQISLVTLGILQYIAPTMQFLLGVLVYREALPPERLIGFGMIWLALLIYSGESMLRTVRLGRAVEATPGVSG